MFQLPSAKVLLCLVIIVPFLVMVRYMYLSATHVHVITPPGHLATSITTRKVKVATRHNHSLISMKSRVEHTPDRRASTADTDVSPLKTEKIPFKHTNVIKTALKTPMAAISRNILDRYPEYLQIKQVNDFKELYDAQFCVIKLDRRKTGAFTAGTELTVRINLYNGYNQALTQGGDLLNIWLRDAKGTSSVAGHVVDHMNGTYTGHVMAFWAGNVSIKVSVTNTKEGIGLYTNYVNEHGSYKFINATFSANRTIEMTQCAPTYGWLDKTYGGFCNLTHENYNISLFCGKPKSVSCRSWVKYGWDDSLYYDDYTKKILRYKDVLLKKIQVTIGPGSNGDLDYPVPTTPCNALPRALTWNSTVPSGFLYKGVYHNLICQPTVDRSREKYQACLKNRPVVSVGDSTTRQWFMRLATVLKLKAGIPKFHTWQKFAHAYSHKLGLDIEWQPHELPFHGTPGSNRKDVKSVACRLDRIPANSTDIVIIHWYAHIARCCDHVALREHVRNAKAAIVRLLVRSPDVLIFIKGPHLVTFPNANKPYAYIGMFVEQVLLEEFKDLLDKIIYLDQWDMSVANENVNIHPDPKLDDISLNNLINFACKVV